MSLSPAEIERIIKKVDRRINSRPQKSAFDRWLDTLISEKGLDTEQLLSVEGPSGANIMPLNSVISAIKRAPKSEQFGIKNMLVKIDFMNGSILSYFAHLAKAIAL